MYKKILNIFLIIVLLMVSFTVPSYRVKAQTLGELKKELEQKEEYYSKLQEEKDLTIAERENINKEIAVNENKILELKKQNEELEVEIANLNKSIEDKYTEIKRIINYQQVSSGESSYLEYIFGAKTFTDFIYRASVAEQLSRYNKELMDEYEQEVNDKKTKQDEIAIRQEEIDKLQIQLANQYAKLGLEINDLNDKMMTSEDEAKLLRANILDLQNAYNCSDDEDIEVCKQRAINSSYIPPSTGNFLRPINDAVVTANYGYYDPYYNGNVTWHAAMDLAGNSGANIYAAADGKVVEVKHQNCGNWIVYIVHNINGHRYTTGYWHMRAAYVSVGQYVTSNTVIGMQGGKPYEDTCSTGEHLDFVLTEGAYKTDYFGNPRNVSIDPRNYIYFPPLIERATGVGTSREWHER